MVVSDTEPEFYRDIKPIVDSRCVVCHGCYDAPCQLKMSSFESIDRGASKDKVYDGRRLLAANLSRISVDAGTTEEWRQENFFPVLNERQQTPETNQRASAIYRMLQLKQSHPLPADDILPDSFDFSLNRKQQCSKIEDFDSFEDSYPLWGMPYGLPAIEKDKQRLLEQWVTNGAKAVYPGVAPSADQLIVDDWERFFNGKSNKQQLMSRYIYEHLFLANLYFSSNKNRIGEQREFFKLVRSKTPPGEAVEIIPSRRPFDDPGGPVFYRLQRVKSTVLVKQHLPYLLDEQRMERWTSLFLAPEYSVSSLPDYKPETASNPFETFKQLPVDSRYRFMLDEAQFSIMGFIKGPVCRGQVALNAINDHFWVVFIDPDMSKRYISAEFLSREAGNLRLPAERESNAWRPVSAWMEYSTLEKNYLRAKKAQLDKMLMAGNKVDSSLLWDGNGSNRNAALTVFRHNDSSSVIQGLVGDTPKTAWLIGYPLLERIHYLLVSGFDVYGNVGHQLLTRLYMDFLRMEGEYSFLSLLPNDVARRELDFWYRDAESKVDIYIQDLLSRREETSGIKFKTDNPKQELFELIRADFGADVIADDVINRRPWKVDVQPYQRQLQLLSGVQGLPLEHLSEQSIMRLTLADGSVKLVSLIRNRAHSNVSELFGENKRLKPKEQTLTVVEDVVGAYPNTFYDINETDLSAFVEAVSQLASEQDYHDLVSSYGVRRGNKNFWAFSDDIHRQYLKSHPIAAGFLDYNRIENR
ncbi:MAG: fatty acid cis/trans isomerase [Spongiibacteraceae bacterium]